VSKRVGALVVALGLVMGGSVHGQREVLPKDIDPGSRSRLPLPTRDDVDDAGKQIFDTMFHGSRASTRFYSPRLAKPLAEAHHHVKFETDLGARLTELAVLVAAREMNNQFEWTQWEDHGRGSVGDRPALEASTIDIVKYCKPVTGLGAKEAAIITFGRELFDRDKVSSGTFAEAVRLFGRQDVANIVELMGLYAYTGVELVALDTQLEKGQTPLLPPASSTPACARMQRPVRAAVPSATAVPADIDPRSRNRFPYPTRNEMDEAGKKIWDEMSHGGPTPTHMFPGRLQSPELAIPLADAHYYVKFETGLGTRVTELAILTTAREVDSQFEWTQAEDHGNSGKTPPEAGQAIVDVIKYCKPVAGLHEKDRVVINFGRELFGRNHVSAETFASALRLFGRRGVVDLAGLMGLYTESALALRAYDLQLPPGRTPSLPVRGVAAPGCAAHRAWPPRGVS
jgi:4-carboxymuconolactone decarboxylase